MAKKRRAGTKQYSAPALEKGLDILELLADEAEGISQVRIAQQLNRSSAVIFRMLDCLERRGYIHRDPQDDLYRLTSRLFEMAHRHPRARRLLETALPIMRQLSEATSQSCHLSVCHEGNVLVIGEVRCPGFIGFSVQAGARVPMSTTGSGMVLLASQSDEVRQQCLEIGGERLTKAKRDKLLSRLKTVRRNGYEQLASHYTQGVTDISCPVTDHTGHAVAALTVPCIIQHRQHITMKQVRDLLVEAAAAISSVLGGAA